jgi:curli biogenesis system outer membrane secretion channel CsgG
MKAIFTTSLFLFIATVHFSFGQTKTTTTVITKTVTKEVDTPPIDTANGTVSRTYTFTFNTKFGGNFGVYNFWEATRNLSQSINTALPAARRFGFGINYYANAMFNN